MQNRTLQPMGLAKPGKTRRLTVTCPGLACQYSVGPVSARVWNRRDTFLQAKPRPRAGYLDQLLTLPTTHSADFSACCCSYSLCAIWICQWRERHSDVFSGSILRYIVLIHCEKFYSRILCIRQSHIRGWLDKPPVVQLRKDRCYSIPVGAPQPRLTHLDFIPHSFPLLPALLNSHRHTLLWIVASLLNSALLTPHSPPLSAPLR